MPIEIIMQRNHLKIIAKKLSIKRGWFGIYFDKRIIRGEGMICNWDER